VQQGVREPVFGEGTFPDGGQIKKAWRKLSQAENARPLPFANATPGRVTLSVDLYGARIDAWFAKVRTEKEPPTDEQWYVLRQVRDRVLLEHRIEKEGMHLPKGETRKREEEPLRGLINGPPGSGKSELIKFLRRFFVEALEWSHGVDFVFAAYQNKVAHAMKGVTIHNAGMLDLGQQSRQGEQTDVDVLFTKNQDLKWVLVDEAGMVSDNLLGSFGHALGEASNRPPRFKMRHNGQPRIFGGYNLLTFGDFQQLAPCPPGGPLSVPPCESDAQGASQERARAAKNMFWKDDADAINFFVEVKEQKRITDAWYAHVVTECRKGCLSDESYNFLHGLPTMHVGSWQPATDTLECGETTGCGQIQADWAARYAETSSTAWRVLFARECSLCKARREGRNRLLSAGDPSVQQPPFIDAPYVHRNNEPKYVVANVRAQEVAKRNRSFCYWFKAEDDIQNPEERPKDQTKLEAKLERFLQMHDMKTAGIPGICPLFKGLWMRTTVKTVRSAEVTLLKHTSCTVIGWELHDIDRRHIALGGGERFLNEIPKIIFVQFQDVDWKVEGCAVGVLPIEPKHAIWIINESTEAKSRRYGFHLIPDYASTAFQDARRYRGSDVCRLR
jgi:hypothetical protein